MKKLALLLLSLASPVAAQIPDTVYTHPDDTLKIAVPDTGIYTMDLTRREGSMTLIRHILVISTPKTTEAPPVVAPMAVPAGAFAPPDVVVNGSFEAGWEGFNNGATGSPTGVTRDGANSRDGAFAARRTLAAGPQSAASLFAQFYDPIFSAFGDKSAGRVWVRFSFFLQGAFDGTLRLEQFYRSADDNYGGLFLNGGYLGWGFAEALSNGGSIYNLVPLAGLQNGWHTVEVDFWHNGDRAFAGDDFPSVALWLDGQQITAGQGQPTGGTVWLNGRLNAGRRQFTGDVGNTSFVGTKAAGNRVAAALWLDRIAVSTRGRIGN